MKILVVEDDRTVGQYVKRGLEEQRYHADLVDDGMDIVNNFREQFRRQRIRTPAVRGQQVSQLGLQSRPAG